MAEPKAKPTDGDVTAFLDAVPDERRRAEGHALRALMAEVTGEEAKMWGPSLVGFGEVDLTTASGTRSWFPVGFSPRKAALTLYALHDHDGPADPLLERLGPHTTGKGCLYLKRLDAVDREVLRTMVVEAWQRASA